MKRRLVTVLVAMAILLGLSLIPGQMPKAQAAECNVLIYKNFIYAYGTPLLITGDVRTGRGTIYIDANRNGIVDQGELSLAGAGVENAPEDNDYIDMFTIYGGARMEDFSGDTYIVMTSGYVQSIYGGNLTDDTKGSFSGTTYIKLTGGMVNVDVYGGNNNAYRTTTATSSATVTLIIGSNMKVRFTISAGSTYKNLGFTGTTTAFLLATYTAAGTLYADTVTNGIVKTDDTTYITKGTATVPADLPVTIAEGETMTVKAGSHITINGNFVNNGTLIMEEGANLTLNGSNANNGTITNNGTLNCTNHTHTNACDTTCNFCGAIRQVSDHIYDNACDATCNECSATRQVSDHIYDNDCDATCNECGDTRQVSDHIYDNDCDVDCNECGDTRQGSDHIYDNDCDVDCNECGDTRQVSDHIYDNDCDVDCNECGDTRQVSDHIYDNDCDGDCNECGAIRQVGEHQSNAPYVCVAGSCRNCGVEMAAQESHDYASVCDTTCNVCSGQRETNTLHTWADTDCSLCKEARPVYVITLLAHSANNLENYRFTYEVADRGDFTITLPTVAQDAYATVARLYHANAQTGVDFQPDGLTLHIPGEYITGNAEIHVSWMVDLVVHSQNGMLRNPAYESDQITDAGTREQSYYNVQITDDLDAVLASYRRYFYKPGFLLEALNTAPDGSGADIHAYEGATVTTNLQFYMIWVPCAHPAIDPCQGGFCEDCVIQVEIQHNYLPQVSEVDCVNDGYTTYTCDACGDSYVADEVPAEGHLYASTYTPATCADAGSIVYRCLKCNHGYLVELKPTGVHTAGQWETVKEATATEAGLKQQSCVICGEVLATEAIPTLGEPAPTEPTVPETTAPTEPTVPETTAPTEPTVPETTAPTEPTVPETTAPAEPTVPETTAPAEGGEDVPGTGDNIRLFVLMAMLTMAAPAAMILGKRKEAM